jgi:hypothetical protein
MPELVFVSGEKWGFDLIYRGVCDQTGDWAPEEAHIHPFDECLLFSI